MISEFHKSRLNFPLQSVYEQVFNQIKLERSQLDCDGVSVEDAVEIYKAIFYDHAEFFFLTHAPKYMRSFTFFSSKTVLLIDYIFSSSENYKMKLEMENIANQLGEKAKTLPKTIEKEKLVCDYLIKKVGYEIDNVYNQNAGTVLCKNKGQCSGIAKAVKYLLDKIGIECIVVEGEAEATEGCVGGPHAWNMVKIDGQYTHLDVTFSIGCNPSKKEPFDYRFFNCSDEEIVKTHSWDRSKYPPCVALKLGATERKPTFDRFLGEKRRADIRFGEGLKSADTSKFKGGSLAKESEKSTAVSDTAKVFSVKPAPTPKPFPKRVAVKDVEEDRASKVKKSSDILARESEKPIIYSYEEFKRQIAVVLGRRISKFQFISKIAEGSNQILINKITSLSTETAKQRAMRVGVKVAVGGDLVSVVINYA